MPVTDNFPIVLANLRAEAGRMTAEVRQAVDVAGGEVVDFARSYTGEMRPPAAVNKAGRYVPRAERGGPRQAHPGGWADVSDQLRNSYKHRVQGINQYACKLTIINSARHAEELEKRQDYWVLRGLKEGGHVRRFVEGRVAEVLAKRRKV